MKKKMKSRKNAVADQASWEAGWVEKQACRETMAVKLDYEHPRRPCCARACRRLPKGRKRRCPNCWWMILPVNGYDVYTDARR